MRKFFKNLDDFFSIINSQIGKPKSVKLVSTGWTNFVYIARSKKGKFVFRFPRNLFFARALEKECEFLQQLYQHDSTLPIPKLRLFYYKNRPYSVHRYIPGKSMTQARLLKYQKTRVAKEIVEFLFALSNFTPNMKLPKTSTFLARLSKVSGKGGYDLSKHAPLIYAEKQYLTLTHGDLNPGNIIIKNGRLKAVLDFAFVSYCSPLDDVARLIGRLQCDFAKFLLPVFERKFNIKVSESDVENLTGVWNYVEQKYVEYIKLNHPDIILPKNFS